jgi:uncharacterized lipoprotein YmbA
MKTVHKAAGIIVYSASIMVGACQSAPTRIYSLESLPPATHIDIYRAPPLRVETLSVPASWDRIQFLKRSPAGALQISDFDHWSAPLAQMARQTLSADLDERLPSGSVIFPRLPRPDGSLGIKVDILEFNVSGSQASMRTSWLISPSAGGAGAKRDMAWLHASIDSAEAPAEAHAWSELIGELADRIAADAASFQIP